MSISTATRACAITLALLLLVKLAWLGAVYTPNAGIAASLAIALLPLMPFAAALAFKLRGLWIYGGIGAWIYFCHGAMEALANPAERGWALAEAAVSAAYFFSLWLRIRALRASAAPGRTR